MHARRKAITPTAGCAFIANEYCCAAFSTPWAIRGQSLALPHDTTESKAIRYTTHGNYRVAASTAAVTADS